VIDFKKEIKLSALFRRPAKAGGESKETASGAKDAGSPRSGKSKSRELVGIKVGASQLAAARVVNNGSPHLRQLARHALPPGIVADGEVRDVAALSAALKEFFTANNLPRRGVRLGIATNRLGVRSFELAGIDDERQLANAVLFRAHEAVSIPVHEAIIDYRVLDKSVDESGTTTRKILLVAAYRDPIERFVFAFQGAGIQLAGIDLEAFALLRAVGAPLPDDAPARSAVVAVNIGHERTTLAVSNGSVCEFTRVLEWGGARLAAAIARELPASHPDGDELENLSFEASASVPGDDPRLDGVREAAQRELQTVARELVASLEYYQGQPGSLPISEILLAGGTSRVSGLAEELERLTRVRVRLADPLVRVEVDESVEERDDLASLAIAIGLGVED
jgi:type IV pilus assembly protein PilM